MFIHTYPCARSPGKPGSLTHEEVVSGLRVMYVTRDRVTTVPATVVHIDRSAEPPQYGIRRDGTAEGTNLLYTELDRLRPMAADGSAVKGEFVARRPENKREQHTRLHTGRGPLYGNFGGLTENPCNLI